MGDYRALLSDPKITQYHALLVKWQKALNLVAPSTLKDAKDRHFLDSLQLIPHLPEGPLTLVDMGSGAGFPGVVIACARPDIAVHLIESDERKGIFMATVSRETQTPVTIHTARIEAVEGVKADVVTARALAPLDELLGYAYRFSPSLCVFLKGENHKKEIEAARQYWHFDVAIVPSITEKNAALLKITNLIKKP